MKNCCFLSFLAALPLATALESSRCTAYEPCWPSPKEWSRFNASIDGRLLASRPPAAVCHGPDYDAALCAEARKNWASSDWRTAQPGAYSAILWELGPDQCFINSTIDAPCGQGLVAEYTVNASSVEDIQKAVRWAAKKNLALTVKNTGHDHLGRSSGRGAFAIWTHHLKGRTWRDNFRPTGAPKSVRGVPAVTLQAGEQWLDVYRDADVQERTVVGGSARTVGAAGGWLTGGGHSAWSHFYGLGVDSKSFFLSSICLLHVVQLSHLKLADLLEVEIVTATGAQKVLNEYTDPLHFWAIRGGGGTSWGIITAATYLTHPLPTHINVVFAQFVTGDPVARREILRRTFRHLVNITEQGYTGYGTLGSPIGLIFLQPNGTTETAASLINQLNEFGNVDGHEVEAQVGTLNFLSWIAYCDAFLSDPNIATNVIDPSRLLSTEVLGNSAKIDALLDFMELYPDMHAGFNFIGKVNSEKRDQTAVHEAWKSSHAILSVGTDWPDETPEEEKIRRKRRAVEVSRQLGEIVGKKGGTYVNEANPYEEGWENVFWGRKYERLKEVKRRVDPKGLFRCNRCVGGDVVYDISGPL